ncbi:hypothetical protein FIBSPDRAFT_940862 [Athelia psychrophila]|uniref:Uncharacterized protein n=1 Tax=Athelia psychrophila TaxID=1759441 RepID=A0A167V626_9AGAM|nr:hypothetical protein FIBSPDRAFT_940862 [Fibularhizoctonia sp. CBS 109695]
MQPGARLADLLQSALKSTEDVVEDAAATVQRLREGVMLATGTVGAAQHKIRVRRAGEEICRCVRRGWERSVERGGLLRGDGEYGGLVTGIGGRLRDWSEERERKAHVLSVYSPEVFTASLSRYYSRNGRISSRRGKVVWGRWYKPELGVIAGVDSAHTIGASGDTIDTIAGVAATHLSAKVVGVGVAGVAGADALATCDGTCSRTSTSIASVAAADILTTVDGVASVAGVDTLAKCNGTCSRTSAGVAGVAAANTLAKFEGNSTCTSTGVAGVAAAGTLASAHGVDIAHTIPASIGTVAGVAATNPSAKVVGVGVAGVEALAKFEGNSTCTSTGVASVAAADVLASTDCYERVSTYCWASEHDLEFTSNVVQRAGRSKGGKEAAYDGSSGEMHGCILGAESEMRLGHEKASCDLWAAWGP